MQLSSAFRAGCAVLLTLAAGAVYGQDGTRSGASTSVSILSPSTNKLNFRTLQYVCGGVAQAGTPIAANSPPVNGANKTSGTITVSGIPATIGGLPTTVSRAHLFWTVLTDSALNSGTGSVVLFNGTPVSGLAIGAAPQSPCFPQTNSLAYRADVTSLVASPGNGAYTVSGFPGGADFSEGATLQILWSNPNGSLNEDNLYHALGIASGSLAVTQAELFSQNMAINGTNATGPVTATLFEVIGNGQTAPENLRFTAACSPAGGHNFDNTLDGSTVAHAPSTCDSAIPGNQCFWDDDAHDVSSDFACPAGNSAHTANLTSDPTVSTTVDCFDWPALNLLTSTDEATAIAACGTYVDNQCPTGDSYKNHGDYVSCVSHAAERFLSAVPLGGSCPRESIQSGCVNPRARSDIGKP